MKLRLTVMTKQWIEKRDSYTGPAQLLTEDRDLSYSVDVRVTGYVTMHEIDTLGGQSFMEGVRSWDAVVIEGITEQDRFNLIGRRMLLQLPDGLSGGVVLKV